jgi:hypothetical protein
MVCPAATAKATVVHLHNNASGAAACCVNTLREDVDTVALSDRVHAQAQHIRLEGVPLISELYEGLALVCDNIHAVLWSHIR